MADDDGTRDPVTPGGGVDLRLFAEAVSGAHDAIIITDAELDRPGPRTVYVNEAFERMSGYAASEVVGETPRMLQGPDSSRSTLEALRARLETGRTFNGSIINYHKNGTPYHVELRVAPIFGRDGTITHFVSQQRDISDQVKSNAERERLVGALEEIPDEVIITDAAGRITYVNRAYRERTGMTQQGAAGTMPRVLAGDTSAELDAAGIRDALNAGQPVICTIRKQDHHGRWLDIEQRVAPVTGERGEITQFVITGRNVSERVAAERALTRLATTDQLTGLNNRLRFEELLGIELERFRRGGPVFSLALLDIDDFKAINDAHGHEKGDEVLQELAQLLTAHTRAGDTVGRWGGEEFTVLLPDTSHDDARRAAEKLGREVAARPFALPHGITLSFGVTEAADNDSIKALLRRADRALYQAKENGKNRVEVTLAR